MRFFMLFLVLILLVGCSAKKDVEEGKFNVSFMNPYQDAYYDNITNTTLEKLSFVFQNNEPFSLNCSVDLSVKNSTNSSVKHGYVGVLSSDESKNVSMKFNMFSGDGSISVVPDCKRVD